MAVVLAVEDDERATAFSSRPSRVGVEKWSVKLQVELLTDRHPRLHSVA